MALLVGFPPDGHRHFHGYAHDAHRNGAKLVLLGRRLHGQLRPLQEDQQGIVTLIALTLSSTSCQM